MAEATFNRELGAAPAGITRFGQFRTANGDDVDINGFSTFTADGSIDLADRYSVTFTTTGTCTITLSDGFGIREILFYNAEGTLLGNLAYPKTSRRVNPTIDLEVTSGDVAQIYVIRKGRSESEYRLTLTI